MHAPTAHADRQVTPWWLHHFLLQAVLKEMKIDYGMLALSVSVSVSASVSVPVSVSEGAQFS